MDWQKRQAPVGPDYRARRTGCGRRRLSDKSTYLAAVPAGTLHRHKPAVRPSLPFIRLLMSSEQRFSCSCFSSAFRQPEKTPADLLPITFRCLQTDAERTDRRRFHETRQFLSFAPSCFPRSSEPSLVLPKDPALFRRFLLWRRMAQKCDRG
jgi:hypothetical protein